MILLKVPSTSADGGQRPFPSWVIRAWYAVLVDGSFCSCESGWVWFVFNYYLDSDMGKP